MAIDTTSAENILETEFEKQLFRASFNYLSQTSDPLRFNSFSASIRELFRHILSRLSPDENVGNCSWFKAETENGKPTRRQRLSYAIRGGLSDDFLKGELDFEYNDSLKEILRCINLLSKYTHVNEKTFNIEQSKCDEYSENVIESFVSIFDLVSSLKETLKDNLHEYIGEEILSTFMDNVFDDLDILSSRTHQEDSQIENFEIIEIDNIYIHIAGEGYVEASLNYGKGEDATEFSVTFPFDFKCQSSVYLPKDLNINRDDININTTSWYE